MLRIHFTQEDLGRTRLAAGPKPMWEVLLSLHKLGDRHGTLVFDEWRRRVRARLPAATRWLLEVAPPRGYSPDFLTPAADAADLEQELDLVLSTPGRRIRADLGQLATQQPVRGQVAALAHGTHGSLHELAAAIRSYHRISLAPYWPQIQVCVQADLAARTRSLVHAGLDKVLSDLHPHIRWQPPVLEIPFAVDQDLHLDGRGLLLVPSFFCWKKPTTLKDPALAPVLVFPIEHDLTWLHRPPATARERSLAALLGHTRALVLAAIAADCCTTTQLAQRAGISIASASQHATVLRDSGLITTRRRGSCVIHAITSLGTSLIATRTGPRTPALSGAG